MHSFYLINTLLVGGVLALVGWFVFDGILILGKR